MSALRLPLAVVGGAILLALAALAVFPSAIAPYDPRALAGSSLELPSVRHLLGTNHLGQDVLSQVIWGARLSLTVAVGASLVAIVVGVVIGVCGGLLAGWADVFAMRVVDVFLAVPRLPLVILVASLVGPSRTNLILVIGLVSWAPAARIVRSQTLTLRQHGFVAAARGFGGGVAYATRRHLVPALGPVLVAVVVDVAARAALMEAGLAFLGLSDLTGVSWGMILNRAFAEPGLYFSPMWQWLVLPAGFAITLAVLGFTFLGVGLEPLMNPRTGRRS